MNGRRILIVDDEEGVRSSLSLLLQDEGYETRVAQDASTALAIARDERLHIVISDIRMPKRSGLDLLPDMRGQQPDAILLVMSAFGDLEQAVAAVQAGADDYLSKPFQLGELLLTIRKAEERKRLERENQRMRRELRGRGGSRALVAASEAMKQVVELVESASEYKTTVLITGESGSGKEVVARTIHDLSDRASEPFIGINCGAIPDTLIESEFFGHVKGAFTGASESKPGLFREANGGTLFLDEIGELSLSMQVKLLRVLQEEEVRPVGEPKPLKVDVRILAATARELEAEVEAGRFRPDLFYRLNVFRIVVPPLRDRGEDLPVLVDSLLETLSERVGKSVEPVDRDVIAALRSHPWPGNVRELENCLERALILARGRRLTVDLLPFRSASGTSATRADKRGASQAPEDLSIKRQSRLLEERLIRKALQKTGGNRTQASRILEISARALQYKIKEYAIGPLNTVSGSSDSDKE